MASIFKEVKLGWKGEQYTIQPSMRLVQAIEQEVSIAGLVTRSSKGHLPISHVAFVLSYLLTSAGAPDATQENVYSELYQNEELLVSAIRAISTAFLPSGNSDSSDPKAAGAEKKISRETETPTSTGAAYTAQ